jgi:hypothetical protein
MEIILLWLDDLDDLIFLVVHTIERLRWLCLQIGLAAASGLAIVNLADVLAACAPTLSGVALASLILWTSGTAVRQLPVRTRAIRPGA